MEFTWVNIRRVLTHCCCILAGEEEKDTKYGEICIDDIIKYLGDFAAYCFFYGTGNCAEEDIQFLKEVGVKWDEGVEFEFGEEE